MHQPPRTRPGKPGTMNALAWQADHVSDHFPGGLQRSAIVLVQVLGVDPQPQLLVHRPQVKTMFRRFGRSMLGSLRAVGDDVEEDAARAGSAITGTYGADWKRPVAASSAASGDARYASTACKGAASEVDHHRRPCRKAVATTGATFAVLLARAMHASLTAGRRVPAGRTPRRRPAVVEPHHLGEADRDHCERQIDHRSPKRRPDEVLRRTVPRPRAPKVRDAGPPRSENRAEMRGFTARRCDAGPPG